MPQQGLLKQHEVYRALRTIESLAKVESIRVSREKAKKEREQRSESFSDDPGFLLAALMSGEQSEAGLRILADDVSAMCHRIDFECPTTLEDIRQLAEQFMQVASAANDSIDDPNSAQAYAWQRAFRLLRKVSTSCYPGQIAPEEISVDEAVPTEGIGLARMLMERRAVGVMRLEHPRSPLEGKTKKHSRRKKPKKRKKRREK